MTSIAAEREQENSQLYVFKSEGNAIQFAIFLNLTLIEHRQVRPL